MTGLQPVTGAYHLYVKSVRKENCQAFFWSFKAAFTCAALLSRAEDAFLTETIEHKGEKTTRVYRFAKGEGMPDLLAPAEDAPAPATNGRRLELDRELQTP